MIEVKCDQCGKNIPISFRLGELQGEDPPTFFQRPTAIVLGSMVFEHYSPVAVYCSSVGEHFVSCSVGCSEQAVKNGRVDMEYRDIGLLLQGNRWKVQYNRAVRQAQVNLHNLDTKVSDVVREQEEADETKWTV